MSTSGLSRLLVKERLLTVSDCQMIARDHSNTGAAFAKVVIALGIFDDEKLAHFLHLNTKFDMIPHRSICVTLPGAEGTIDIPLMQKLEVVPIKLENKTLSVAMADPLDQSTLQQLAFFTPYTIRPVIASLTSIYKTLQQLLVNFAPADTILGKFLFQHRVVIAAQPSHASTSSTSHTPLSEEPKSYSTPETEPFADQDSFHSNDAEDPFISEFANGKNSTSQSSDALFPDNDEITAGSSGTSDETIGDVGIWDEDDSGKPLANSENKSDDASIALEEPDALETGSENSEQNELNMWPEDSKSDEDESKNTQASTTSIEPSSALSIEDSQIEENENIKEVSDDGLPHLVDPQDPDSLEDFGDPEETVASFPESDEIEQLNAESNESFPEVSEVEELSAESNESFSEANKVEQLSAESNGSFSEVNEVEELSAESNESFPEANEVEELSAESNGSFSEVNEVEQLSAESNESFPEIDEVDHLDTEDSSLEAMDELPESDTTLQNDAIFPSEESHDDILNTSPSHDEIVNSNSNIEDKASDNDILDSAEESENKEADFSADLNEPVEDLGEKDDNLDDSMDNLLTIENDAYNELDAHLNPPEKIEEISGHEIEKNIGAENKEKTTLDNSSAKQEHEQAINFLNQGLAKTSITFNATKAYEAATASLIKSGIIQGAIFQNNSLLTEWPKDHNNKKLQDLLPEAQNALNWQTSGDFAIKNLKGYAIVCKTTPSLITDAHISDLTDKLLDQLIKKVPKIDHTKNL